MNKSIQDNYLNGLVENNVMLSVYLINGIKLNGIVSSFDDNVIVLSDSKSTIAQLIYKHAISTIVPSKVS